MTFKNSKKGLKEILFWNADQFKLLLNPIKIREKSLTIATLGDFVNPKKKQTLVLFLSQKFLPSFAAAKKTHSSKNSFQLLLYFLVINTIPYKFHSAHIQNPFFYFAHTGGKNKSTLYGTWSFTLPFYACCWHISSCHHNTRTSQLLSIMSSSLSTLTHQCERERKRLIDAKTAKIG